MWAVEPRSAAVRASRGAPSYGRLAMPSGFSTRLSPTRSGSAAAASIALYDVPGHETGARCDHQRRHRTPPDPDALSAEKRRPDGPEEERERQGRVRLHQSLGLAAALQL